MARINTDKIVAFAIAAKDYVTYPLLTLAEITEIRKRCTVPGQIWEFKDTSFKPHRFNVEAMVSKYVGETVQTLAPVEKPSDETVEMYVVEPPKEFTKPVQIVDQDMQLYIPQVDPVFIPHGENYDIIDNIISSHEFFPTYIFGVSGVGKTSSISHSCAINKRPFFRVQITKETVDEDLIGGMKLENGNTVWQDGPVMIAYKCGGVLLLDECDLNNALMILQPILECKPFYIKQTGELVHPKAGFTVFATGNSKGTGEDSRFIGTTVLNSAFRERFALMLEQDLPPINIEKRIITKLMKDWKFSIEKNLLNSFLKWIDLSRKSYADGNIEDYISTRRVQHILRAYKITSDFRKALDMSLTLYDNVSKEALMLLWDSVYSAQPDTDERPEKEDDRHPF